MRIIRILALTCALGFAAQASGMEAAKEEPIANITGKVTSNYPLPKLMPPKTILTGESYARISKIKGDRRTRGVKEASIYAKYSDSVVLIVTDDGLGSGIIIDKKGTILTNWHVVQGYETVAVVLKPKENTKNGEVDVFKGVVLKVDEVSDLALLSTDIPESLSREIKISTNNVVEVGSNVHAIGHPTGEAWTYTRGYVSQVRPNYKWSGNDGVEHEADVIQTQTPINPGNSGGPLLTDNGSLIGVNSFKADGEGLNYAVGTKTINEFISRVGDRQATITKGKKTKSSTKDQQKDCGDDFVYEKKSKDKKSTHLGMDLNCDGKPDAELRIPNDKSKPVVLAIDTNDDSTPDQVYIDEGRDGKWDSSIHDFNFDRKWDMDGHHIDGELEPAYYTKIKDKE